MEGVLRNGNDLTVDDVTSSRRGYSVHRKNLDAELVWGFGEDLTGVAAPASSCFSSAITLLVMVVRKRRTLVAEPGASSQLDSSGAEDFGHVPEGFVEPEIFIDAFDGSALGHPAPVGAAARVVALTATDKVLLNLCGASRYVEQPC